jgi:hypothetical protein
MHGLVDATLEGCTIGPVHAYAVSSCGLRWGCCGRSDGGNTLARGTGSSVLADCISQGDAGILYGITGVCHQIANRILHPAGITVFGAGAYGQTVGLFGVYGRAWPGKPDTRWPAWLNKCCGAIDRSLEQDTVMKKFSNSRRKIGMSGSGSMPGSFDDAVWLTEFTELIFDSLGQALDAPIFDRLVEIQLHLRNEQSELAERLLAQIISREQYLESVSDAVREANTKGEILLGTKTFRRIFGEPQLADRLIDKEIFLQR